jgi:hypothetical protein
MSYSTDRLLVRKILECAPAYKWSLQGLGMLRLYLSKEVRLHVWDSRYKVPGATEIHDHPWSFRSTIIAGELVNNLFDYHNTTSYGFSNADRRLIQCGPGATLMGEKVPVTISMKSEDKYTGGDTYRQLASDIHKTKAEDGTVTIVKRTFQMDMDEDHAHVFIMHGDSWVSAEPRPATLKEVQDIAQLSLEKWFKED